MSTRVLSDSTHVARKTYPCNACQAWLCAGFGRVDITADEQLIVDAARADKFRVLPGMLYRKVVTAADDGRIYTLRGRLDMDNLCQKYELYEE